MNSVHKLIFMCVAVLFIHANQTQTLSGTVVYVSDGDTFHLIDAAGTKHRVRVADIDCPESTQAYGLEAKAFTLQMIKDKTVELRVKELDPYGRLVAFVKVDEKDLSEELLKAGLAWHYKRYSTLEHFGKMEAVARKERIGLWSEVSPEPPWDYRRRN